MVTVEDFSRLVAGIYDAAVTPQRWRTVIREIHCTLDGTNGGLFSGRASSSFQSTVPVEAVQSYAEYYHRFDHVIAAGCDVPGPTKTAANPAPTSFTIPRNCSQQKTTAPDRRSSAAGHRLISASGVDGIVSA